MVYSAQDLNSPSWAEVAVKVLREAHALDPEMVARFKRELRLMSELRHPHVMPVLASGTDEKHGLWYAMPLALGSLADELGKKMEQERIVAVMREICAGLAHIHGREILHRDLKPENVLRTQAGTWAIADLGLARAVAERTMLTVTAETMGTPFYTAPEQWKDAKRVDMRADIYSAGKILQALVIGGTPVDDEVPAGQLRAVIQRAISQNPNRRYANVADLLAAIEGAVAVVPAGAWETPQERADRLWPRLQEGGVADQAAIDELARWAEETDPSDDDEMGSFAWALSALPADSVEWWWDRDPAGFYRVFQAFTERLEGSFAFSTCDALAGFARRAVAATGDSVILRDAICGLACLGRNHNRWHVRDVVVAILQGVRSEDDAGAAIEGLRMAGKDAAEWTIGDTVLRTFRPTLRAGIINFFEARED